MSRDNDDDEMSNRWFGALDCSKFEEVEDVLERVYFYEKMPKVLAYFDTSFDCKRRALLHLVKNENK